MGAARTLRPAVNRFGAGLLLALLAVATACTSADSADSTDTALPATEPPSLVLGEFNDDYGSSHRITVTTWEQLPGGRLNIRSWHPEEGYLIAQNDSANSYAPGLWTRVDWAELPGDMEPWRWAFCLSAYEAPTAAAAESAAVARRDSLLVGCNGHPFTRMSAR